MFEGKYAFIARISHIWHCVRPRFQFHDFINNKRTLPVYHITTKRFASLCLFTPFGKKLS